MTTTDLLARCAQLVDIPSVSHDEAAITDFIESELRAVPWLTLDRVDHTLVARTTFGRDRRIILAGHTDTVPANNNDRARIDGDVLWGLGSADMKSGVTVLLELARTVDAPLVDVTYIFYECEEVASQHSGLLKVEKARPELLAGDAAVLAEPTSARIEAGCQGAMRVAVTMTGERAHTARPWMGTNAIHRLAGVLERVAAYKERRPVLNGCEFREALQAVHVEGGVAGNVVPDRAVVTINHRYAPDRTTDEAFEHVRSVVADALGPNDAVELRDAAAPAPPALDHPLLADLVARVDAPPMAKLGWTDVSFFANRGTPATNFGPGDPNVAHSANEHVQRQEIERVHAALEGLLTTGAA
ncbi:MAG: succinyl-diaminopimelate desuccinylase [Actinobacteria bacterium]|nr:succinyl-diaminopimelate desuccinylase [Actinomycetota bacterium]